jgi:hypothetical protein
MPCSSCKQFGGDNGMPLSYVNRGYTEPSASAGSNILGSEVGLARPVINPTGGKRTTLRKRRTLRKRTTLHKRKALHKCNKKHAHTRKCMSRGGFYPSVMGSFVQNASSLVPAAAVTGYRMVRNYKNTRRHK